MLFDQVPAPAVDRDPVLVTTEMPAELYARKSLIRAAVRNPDGVVSGALRFESVPDATKRAEGVFIIGYPRPAASVLSWALTEHTIDDVEAIHEQVHS